MSWIIATPLNWFQTLCINVLKCGPMPRHIAFIMDGNRRYAKKRHMQRNEGHTKGFDRLAETWLWCRQLGIKEVTVYAFSIENFKRTEDEVEAMMNLAREKFERLMEEKEKFMQEGLCIRVIGNLSLLPDDIKKLIAQAVLMTKDNNKAFLNIAFAYTSRDEMTTAVESVVQGVKEGKITVDDIDEDLLSSCMYTNQSPPPDIIIRSSGEVRFSDFLLWQIHHSQVNFTACYWPEFSIWDLLGCIFKYQRCFAHLHKYDRIEQRGEKSERVDKFIKTVNDIRTQKLEMYLNS